MHPSDAGRRTLDLLARRAELLERLRGWMRDDGFVEVWTPVAMDEVIPERHIEPVALPGGGFLQASPELAMKRMLCFGAGPIFQAASAFRAGERGRLHAPEFTIVEWYRPGDGMSEGMDRVALLVEALVGGPPAKRTTYRDAVVAAVGVDPHTAGVGELRAAARGALGERAPDAGDDRDGWLEAIVALAVEPRLGRDGPEFLTHYPASQAALARTTRDDRGCEVAERFELYWRGVELANGYAELTDAAELRARLSRANALREADGDCRLPLPARLLADMERRGLPESCGVALGFDRLAMLALGAETIAEVRADGVFVGD